jgi:hypothetical protein
MNAIVGSWWRIQWEPNSRWPRMMLNGSYGRQRANERPSPRLTIRLLSAMLEPSALNDQFAAM